MNQKIKDNLSIYIPVYNEEKNIELTLSKLESFKKIFLIDSNSKDETINIAKKYNNINIINTNLKSYIEKLNFAIKHCKEDYIMILDADYVLNEVLVKNINNLYVNQDIEGYFCKFYFLINKTIIREKIYPSKVFLFKNKYQFSEIGHKESLNINYEKLKCINGEIYHNDKKDFNYWIKSQVKIAKKESDFIIKSNTKNLKEFVRKIPFLSIILAVLYFGVLRRVLFYFPNGYIFLFHRIVYETILNYFILKKRLFFF